MCIFAVVKNKTLNIMRIFIGLVIISLVIISCATQDGGVESDLKRNSIKVPVAGVDMWKESMKIDVGELEVNNIGRDWLIPFRSPALGYLMPIQDRYGFQLADSYARLSRVYCVNRLPLDSLKFLDDLIPAGFSEYDIFYTHILTGEEMEQRAWFMVLPTPFEQEDRVPRSGFFSNMDTTFTVKELRLSSGSPLTGYQFYDENDKAVAAITIGENATGYILKSFSDPLKLALKSAFASIALKTSGQSLFSTDIENAKEYELDAEQLLQTDQLEQ
jgi:hypothetical protein